MWRAKCARQKLYSVNTGGYRIAAIMRPCQGRNGGSTPPTRSKEKIPSLDGIFSLELAEQRSRTASRNCRWQFLDAADRETTGRAATPPTRILNQWLSFLKQVCFQLTLTTTALFEILTHSVMESNCKFLKTVAKTTKECFKNEFSVSRKKNYIVH